MGGAGMSGMARCYQRYVASFFGLFLSWIGVIAIAAGIVAVLRGLQLFPAQLEQLFFWGKLALLGSVVVYGVIMFAMTWSFARSVGLSYLPALAYSVWSVIPLLNLIPLGILVADLRHLERKGINPEPPREEATTCAW